MTKENTMQFRRIYNILLSVVIVIAGICLMAACLNIYQSGDQPFSRESVAAAFSGIAFPVYLCLAMVLISVVLELVLPSEKEKSPVFKPYRAILNRLQTKRDFSQCDAALRNEISALQKQRKAYSLICAFVLFICSAAFLVYACDSSNFHQSNINSSMIAAMKVLLPCALLSFATALSVTIQNERSLAKEIELMKQIPAAKNTEAADNIAETSEKRLNLSRTVIIVVAAVCMVYGFISGGTIDVLAKAINICTECIGLG